MAEHPAVVTEFTHQAEAFAAAPVMRARVTLEDFVALLPAGPDQRWLDVACGPGIVSSALARRVAGVVGVDLTPAMVEQAAIGAAAAGVGNARFVEGDATALPFGDGGFDGSVTRFSLHHIPHPLRVVREMARVVRLGGHVAVADHLTSPDPAAAAWHYEIERLRDPSHWRSLSADALGALGRQAGLVEVARRVTPFDLDWEEWLQRGSGGRANRLLIEGLLGEPPAGSGAVFRLDRGRLHLSLGVFVWKRPTTKEGLA